ncbi:type I-E CRISPR-associated protein Cas5/CasD [Thiothrix subterranea]|uniref:type I-E CRISPR-associated protein Cas5/CasD n=1 Tax=Thiothrix subterranea TaxID=2735563 RepID=UPI00192A9843|nr:type I-E CRISPR-associated protein Cas5/CasD [Thiothrix subterranea]QQZ30081.1 type I-E CRISPR-associated protein Cas5/CasD [Thiothrix subterranea]
MNQYLALKLQGVMQAWGGHTYEDLRHTELIPTRSGVLGLLAACLGIDRDDIEQLEALAASVRVALRADTVPQRIMDFHTVMDARKVSGKANEYPVVSRREYLCDAMFTVLLEIQSNAAITRDRLEQAVKKPVYSPFLGRRSCVLSRPLYEDTLDAIDFRNAFSMIEPVAGTVYSETKPQETSTPMRMRDVPLYARKRQFASRQLYIYQLPGKESAHVPE